MVDFDKARTYVQQHGSGVEDAGVPTTHPLLETAAHLLTQMQREDGSWMSDDDPLFDARTTVEAVRALLIKD